MTDKAQFKTTIGLEVHVQLALSSKLFSHAPHAFGGEPNSRVTATDLALPGVLPVLNQGALDLALRAAIALDAVIAERTSFARKNYFYPDLPKGYQISQTDEPFCHGGRVPLGDGRYGAVHHIHLEEDAGKTIHTDRDSLVDLNRSGSALIEIVGEPDLETAADAKHFLQQLKQILQYAGVSDCDMEKGSLRCDANISLCAQGQDQLGTKVEIKNLNSFKMVVRALEYEEQRQAKVLATGGTIHQETRGWDDNSAETILLRSKSDSPDYRFFPEPDLPAITITQARIKAAQEAMPELPAARIARFAQQYGLDDYTLDAITTSLALGDFFEALACASGDAKQASHWILSEVLRAQKETKLSLDDFPLRPERLAGLLLAAANKKVSHQAAKRVFDQMVQSGQEAQAAIDELGLGQISDPEALRLIVQKVLSQNEKSVTDYRAGKTKALHALKGRCMRESSGRADPSVLEAILRTQLET